MVLGYAAVAVVWVVVWHRLTATSPGSENVLLIVRQLIYVGAATFGLWWLLRRRRKKTGALDTRFAEVAEQGAVGIFIARANRLLYVNDALCRMLAYSPEELTSRAATDFLDPVELEKARVRGGGGDEGEVYRRFLARRSDGSVLPTHLVRRAVELEDGVAWTGVVIDASHSEPLEGPVRHDRESETTERRAGAVSEDFNQLLGAMMAQLDRALGSLGADQAMHGGLSVARDTARKAAALTGRGGGLPSPAEDEARLLDVSATIRSLGGLFKTLGGSSVDLKLELDETLAPVNLVLGEFERLLVSLFLNAKHSLREGGSVTVRTRTVARADTIRLAVEVEDDGRATRSRSNLDVGLATPRAIVEQAGGALEIEINPGVGTLVRAVLPLRGVPGMAEQAAARSRAGWRAGHTILVVDDEPSVRRVVTAALKRQGYVVLEAADATAALGHLSAARPPVDLVVCDFMLEGVTGVDLVRQMRALRPNLKALFITGLMSAELVDEDPTLAAFTFIEKPFSVEALTESVDRIWEEKVG